MLSARHLWPASTISGACFPGTLSRKSGSVLDFSVNMICEPWACRYSGCRVLVVTIFQEYKTHTACLWIPEPVWSIGIALDSERRSPGFETRSGRLVFPLEKENNRHCQMTQFARKVDCPNSCHCPPSGRAPAHSTVKAMYLVFAPGEGTERQQAALSSAPFRRLKKTKCQEMSARSYAFRYVCLWVSFFPFSCGKFRSVVFRLLLA